MEYKCVFFDLDHTLWDYETNSRETLDDIYRLHKLDKRGIYSHEHFYICFREVNIHLWNLYDRGLIDSHTIRKERFKKVLEFFKAYEEKLSSDLSNDYLTICPAKINLLPNAIDTLNYLRGKYRLTVITNGFEEIQQTKLTAGNLSHFFDHIITSQRAGCRKPASGIFEFALKSNSIDPRQAIMVGDNLINDIQGARSVSIDTVFFNPESHVHTEKVAYEIKDLKELCDIL
jgi:YjjG family noncanonical pyrimidine nucleotidase